MLHQAIGELEASMKSNLLKAKAMLPDVYEKAKFNNEDLFVILEGKQDSLVVQWGKILSPPLDQPSG